MGLYIAKDTGVRVTARQPIMESPETFEMWLLSMTYDPANINVGPYDWFIPISPGEGIYRILSDDDFDEWYTEAPTVEQGG